MLSPLRSAGEKVPHLPELQRKLSETTQLSTAVTRFDLDMLRKPRKVIHLKYYGFSIDNASKKASNCRKTSI